MKHLDKTQQKEWQALTTALETARDALMPHVTKWNDAVEAMGDDPEPETLAERTASELANTDIATVWTNYTDALESVQSFAEGIRDEAQSYYDEKSERWQEGDKGQEYNLFIESWGEVADMDIPELADSTDDVTGELSEPEAVDDGPIQAAQMFPGQ
jgi:hypothetical protein